MVAKEQEKLLSFRYLPELIISLTALGLILIFYSKFLVFIEGREGISFIDPILVYVKPIDLSWISFGFIYGGILLAFLVLLKHPEKLIALIQSYGILILLRMLAMYSLPLDPPPTLIPLHDPLVEYFGTGTLLTRDLFFSGHTSLAFLLYLAIPKGKLKYLFLFSAIVIAGAILMQHVHYFVDVLVAPFFSYASWKIICSLRGSSH